MAHKILLLNGPNLNLLGSREPEFYGADTLDEIVAAIETHADKAGAGVRAAQSNHEGELIDLLHDAKTWGDGVVFNPGAFTHYSYALRDAISAIEIPVVETHLSNVHSREEFRRQSVLSPVCLGVIAGFGRESYHLALDALLAHLDRVH